GHRSEDLSGDRTGRVRIPGVVDRQQHAMTEALRDHGAIDGDGESLFGDPSLAETLHRFRRRGFATSGQSPGTVDCGAYFVRSGLVEDILSRPGDGTMKTHTTSKVSDNRDQGPSCQISAGVAVGDGGELAT